MNPFEHLMEIHVFPKGGFVIWHLYKEHKKGKGTGTGHGQGKGTGKPAERGLVVPLLVLLGNVPLTVSP